MPARDLAAHPEGGPDKRPGDFPRLLALGVCFVFLTSIKLWISERFASDLPNWDQWDAEGLYLLLPWQQGTLSFLDLFAPHNEHRIALTKLWALLLVGVNGQWDARIQMLFNGAVHSLIAVGLWAWLQPLLGSRWARLLWVVALLATFAPPHAWQNNLGGFHSQQYFLLGLSLLGLDRTLRCNQGSPGWFFGIGCLVLALFSMASGPAAAAVALVAVLAFNGPPLKSLRRFWPTALACVIVVALGIALNVRFVGHDGLRAHSFHDFALSLWRALQWPVTFFAPFAVLSYAPWLALCLNLAFARTPFLADRRAPVLAAAGGWVVLQFLAAAYARGANGAWPASRYFDTHTFGLLVNLAILLMVLSHLRASSSGWFSARTVLRTALVVWCVGVGAGLGLHARRVLTGDLPAVRAWFEASTRNTRLYLGTGDRQWMQEPEIPYPSADVLVARLSHPELTRILPVSVARHLTLVPDTAEGFAAERASPATVRLLFAPTWGSHGEPAANADVRRWMSAPITPPRLGYLKFEVAGDLGSRAVALELWSADGARHLATVRPSRVPGDTWRAAYVRTPRESFRVVASDRDAAGWLAFSAPTPMSAGSYWVWRLAAHAPLLTWISGALLFLILPWAIRPVATSAEVVHT
jgi:hypothetical protein